MSENERRENSSRKNKMVVSSQRLSIVGIVRLCFDFSNQNSEVTLEDPLMAGHSQNPSFLCLFNPAIISSPRE